MHMLHCSAIREKIVVIRHTFCGSYLWKKLLKLNLTYAKRCVLSTSNFDVDTLKSEFFFGTKCAITFVKLLLHVLQVSRSEDGSLQGCYCGFELFWMPYSQQINEVILNSETFTQGLAH